jgi:hypothetical protein
VTPVDKTNGTRKTIAFEFVKCRCGEIAALVRARAAAGVPPAAGDSLLLAGARREPIKTNVLAGSRGAHRTYIAGALRQPIKKKLSC